MTCNTAEIARLDSNLSARQEPERKNDSSRIGRGDHNEIGGSLHRVRDSDNIIEHAKTPEQMSTSFKRIR